MTNKTMCVCYEVSAFDDCREEDNNSITTAVPVTNGYPKEPFDMVIAVAIGGAVILLLLCLLLIMVNGCCVSTRRRRRVPARRTKRGVTGVLVATDPFAPNETMV
ncbi:unnamed protein product [Cylicocyclus nassatus]|uniref:Uncharacterized protein n=1 Tax=Cylicocyclus nassatus TaxID=53992 RepID=A0AA36DSF9_CYLNA|nr:unnamed protein product [Cylicocyclus nassatus]CAJ0599975.1 unnamed protein product [Cylicocyclus nassatus]